MPKYDKDIKRGVYRSGRLITPNQTYQENCITFMRKMKQENVLVDVIVTSPPYNISKEYGEYKDNKERDNYLEWLQDVAKGSQPILKDDGSFFLNIGGRPADPVIPFLVADKFVKAGYILQNTIHWIKSVSIDPEDIGKNNGIRSNENLSIGHFKPIISERYLSDLQEYVFHFTKTGNVKIDKLRAGVTYQDKSNIGRWKSAIRDKRDRGNVWVISYPTIQEGRPHPAVFPVKLPQRCIELHGIKPNMLVYDPFMGIGNTALACKRLRVNYLGTEIDPQYIKVAEEQISGMIDTYLQGDEDKLI
jgi:site-specific DNA-methyltransferase (adenine-specific)